MDWKLVWPPASFLPYLLVDLHSWLPQVFEAQPLPVEHHQHRLNLPAQLLTLQLTPLQKQLADLAALPDQLLLGG